MVREVIPRFWKTCRRWYSTVFALMNNWAATSLLLAPVATSRTI
jgi:hypothetical protein